MTDCICEELNDVQKNLLAKVEGKTKHRELAVSIQFPKDYPDSILLIEIKSKVISPSLISHISQVCDQELKKYVGQKQVFILIKFLRKFLDENPLLPCRDELAWVKKEILEDGIDTMKMKQKQGIVTVHVKQKNYFLKFSMTVSEHYPTEKVEMKLEDHNFPASMAYYFVSQAKEFARQAVEPPLKKNPKMPEFQPSPHVKKVFEFLVKYCAKRYPVEVCPICGEQTLPGDPSNIVTDINNNMYADRLFCGHLYHRGCLDKYMKTPPFHEGKKCPKCMTRIYHDKWNISPKLAEERWAHHEARKRELDEVVDFLS